MILFSKANQVPVRSFSMDLSTLAEHLGVSASTISRALNRPEMVSPATRLKVLAGVKSFGYQANGIARSLRTLQTKTIGIIVPDLDNEFFSEIVRVAGRTAKSHGYTTLVSALKDDPLGPAHAAKLLLEHRVSGIVHCPMEAQVELWRLFESGDVPIVEVDRRSNLDRADAVLLDFEKAGRLAADHLIGLGHRRIATMMGPQNLYHARDQFLAFENALREASLELPARYVECTPAGEQPGYEAAHRLLSLPVRPTAIFITQSEVAAGAIRAVRERELKVPKNLSLIAVDDARWTRYMDCPLTVVARPAEKMAVKAIETLISRVERPGEKDGRTVQVFAPTLVIRKSTAPAEVIKLWKFGSTNREENQTLLRWLNRWNAENPDKKVEAAFFDYRDYEQGRVLTTAFASGNAPDLFWTAPGQFLQFVKCGFAADLSDLFTPEFRDDLTQVAIDGVSFEGKPFAVPFEQEPLGLFYNERLMGKVPVPQTWEQLLAASAELKARGVIPIVIEPKPSNYQNFTWFPFLWQTGAEALDPELRRATFDTAGTIRALELWGELIKRGYAPKTCSDLTAEVAATAFGQGRAALQVVGFWAVGYLRRHRPKLSFGVTTLPLPSSGKDVSAYGGWLLMVNATSSNLEIAKEIASWMFIAGTERPVEWCTHSATKFSPRKSVTEAAKRFFDQEPHATFRDVIMPVAKAEPRYPADIERIINDALQDVMFRDVSGQEAAAYAQQKLTRALRSIHHQKQRRGHHATDRD